VKNILVTGANGQLGKCLNELSVMYSLINFVFTNSQELDITNKENIKTLFEKTKFDYCINCAAYTAVDKAESNQDKAVEVNVNGATNLAEVCSQNKTTLIHISTDFVFDGKGNKPYTETDKTNPLSVYGHTKLGGELKIQEVLNNYFIIRTSWLYSEYGANFMKTMLRLGKDRTELSVVGDQIGTPTYAKDLAEVLLKIVVADDKCYGVYHYSNEGVASWYDFAKEIFEYSDIQIKLNEIPSLKYPTPAVRPKFSVLSKEKIIENFGLTIPNWKQSLKKALGNLKD
jgi:dTDP-4-dehydrorhamnose reductase